MRIQCCASGDYVQAARFGSQVMAKNKRYSLLRWLVMDMANISGFCLGGMSVKLLIRLPRSV
jgi:hypothetical protein